MASSTTAITDETIWPTGLDIASVAGEGKFLYEKKISQIFKACAINSRVSGLAIPASSANLNITIASGEAVISGYYIEVPAVQVTAFASVTSHVFLKLARDGTNKVTGGQYEVNDTGTPPADSLKLGTLSASGAAITSTTQSGRTGRIFRRIPQMQVFESSGTFVVPDDVTEILVEVFGAGGGGGGGSESQGTGAPESGASGGTGITSTFDTLSADGGVGGGGGNFPQQLDGRTGAPGAASVGFTGMGMIGGRGGSSGTGGYLGGDGGPGGRAFAVLPVSPGSSISVTVGTGGAGGAGGAGGSPTGADGSPGSAGLNGRVVVRW